MLKSFGEDSFSSEESKLITIEDLLGFYQENIASGLTDFSNLEIEGFICI